MKVEPFVIIILLLHIYNQSLLIKRPSSVTIINRKTKKSPKAVSMLFDDRYLLDTLVSKFKQRFSIKTKTPLSKKLKLMQIAASIMKNSKDKGLKVKKVQIGSKIAKMFKGKRALRLLTKYLNDKDFDIKYKLAKSKYEDRKKKRWLDKLRKNEQRKMQQELKAKLHRKLKRSKPFKGKATQFQAPFGTRGLNQDFQYLPNFGGIPFPPVAVAGVNYHAPMSVVVNTLPYPNPRAYESPYDRAKGNVDNQSKFTSRVF